MHISDAFIQMFVCFLIFLFLNKTVLITFALIHLAEFDKSNSSQEPTVFEICNARFIRPLN